MSTGKKVSRRTVLGATVALGVAGVTGARAAPRRKPNFVFILADDLGAFDFSCYGRPDYCTPRIDSLARDGMKFNYGYANSSSCAPTRVGLISGRYQNRLEIGSGFGGGYPSDKIGYATDLFTDRACDFIKRNAEQPFLLSLHYNAPHWPWQTRTDRTRPQLNDTHYDGGSLEIYAEMMKALDDGVGRVLDTLDRHRLARDTIVVFTSDNGGERFSYMWPLRGQKGDLWEGGTRVPLIVRWPGRIARGKVSDQVAMSMDFLPTFAALAGASLDPSMPPDGIDLSPQLFGAAPKPRTVFWKTPYDMLSSLSFPWKYVSLGERKYLFNIAEIAEDATEHVNLKLKQPERFASMKREAEAWSAQMRPTLPAPPKDVLEIWGALDPMLAPTK